MKTAFHTGLRATAAFLGLLTCSLGTACAAEYESFTYEVIGDEIEITAYPYFPNDPIVIPAMIEGKPVTRIGFRAFRWTRAPSVTFPDSVVSIGEEAFYSSDLVQINLPPNLQTLGASAFGSCDFTSVTLPDSLEVVGDLAFWGCRFLSTVTLPSQLKTIGNSAFLSCRNLSSISLPASLETIGGSAFLGCSLTPAVHVPAGVTTIGPNAFSHNLTLAEIVVDPANQNYQSVDGVLLNAAGTEVIRCPQGRSTPFSIPEGVTTIHDWAFLLCLNLPAITLPSTLESIGEWGFRACNSITSLSFPASLNSLGLAALAECTQLTSFNLAPQNTTFTAIDGILFDAALSTLIACPPPRTGSYAVPASVTEIEDYAFYQCESLASITLPAGLETIGQRAFVQCQFTEMKIPTTVTSIGASAFRQCSALTSIVIPPGVEIIPAEAFDNCSSMASLTLPPGLTEIGKEAFCDCHALTEVRIPSSVTTIGEDAFFDCETLTRAIFGGDAPVGGLDVFDDAAPSFEIWRLSGSTGFDGDPWRFYPQVIIDETAFPAASWLTDHQLPHDADLNTDVSGDGISILMAYALKLDPRLQLHSTLPLPEARPGELTLSYFAATPGIEYCVETSLDLLTWTTTGVIVSDLDDNDYRTATISRSGGHGFLRLRVKRTP